MANRGQYKGLIGFNIYNPGNKFFANRGVGAQQPTPNHKGADWGSHQVAGVPVFAAVAGKVVAYTKIKGFGMAVIVETDNMPNGGKLITIYGHIKPNSALVNGAVVPAGTLLGAVENAATLTSAGGSLSISASTFLPHLHLQMTLNGVIQDPYTFSSFGELPHMIGTDASGHAIISSTVNGIITCQTVDATGALIAGTTSSNSDLPNSITTPYASSASGTQYYVINNDSEVGRLYNNGVLYIRDTQTTQEYWSIPTQSGGQTEVTKFSNGLITTQTFMPDGTIDTSISATVTLDASASADMQAAFAAWKAAGGDPAKVNPADLRLDQTTGGTSTLLDSRLFNLAGAPYKNNAVLIGESASNGSGGDMLRGGEGNDFLIGSSGNDVLYGGAGKVTIEDKVGNNHVLLNGKELSVLIRQTDGSFKSADGKITGALNGGVFGREKYEAANDAEGRVVA